MSVRKWSEKRTAHHLVGRVDSLPLFPFRRILGPTTAHVDNEGIIVGLQRGDMKCIGPEAKDADLWIQVREEVHTLHQEGVLL